MDKGWGFTQPEILFGAKDQSCGIQSPMEIRLHKAGHCHSEYMHKMLNLYKFLTSGNCYHCALIKKNLDRSWEQVKGSDTVPRCT